MFMPSISQEYHFTSTFLSYANQQNISHMQQHTRYIITDFKGIHEIDPSDLRVPLAAH